MNWEFIPITPENAARACRLHVAPGQENTVETVEQCLAEAKQTDVWQPVLLQRSGTDAGFAMYGFWRGEGTCGRVWLDRFFIAGPHQQKGYAKEVLPLLLAHLRARYGHAEVYLSVYENNGPARRLYESLGFKYNGERDINGERVMVQTGPVPVRGRFAPSPSGRMHVGNVFTALLAWLSCKAAGGRMVLRLEDLDTARCRPEYAALLLEDLHWLGLTWDEGGAVPGYVQSEETAYYETCLAHIAAKAQVYPCFCSREELHTARAPHAEDGTLLYTGRCRMLDAAQQAQKQAVRPGALRLAVPDETLTFTDGVYGPQNENLQRQCGDFILRRSDGLFAYQLAVVADDARMGITQVVRGCDLLSSTARQLYLYRLLGAPPPHYYHVPLLCTPGGRRLSKREQDLDLGALRARCSPQQVIGALGALAGLVPPGTAALPQDLLPRFCWDALPRTNIAVPDDFLQPRGLR